MSRSLLLLLMLCVLSTRAAERGHWFYNVSFVNWVTNNAGSRFHTFTPESAEKRAAEIAAAGYKAVVTSGYHFRQNFMSREAEVNRIAGVLPGTTDVVDASHCAQRTVSLRGGWRSVLRRTHTAQRPVGRVGYPPYPEASGSSLNSCLNWLHHLLNRSNNLSRTVQTWFEP